MLDTVIVWSCKISVFPEGMSTDSSLKITVLKRKICHSMEMTQG